MKKIIYLFRQKWNCQNDLCWAPGKRTLWENRIQLCFLLTGISLTFITTIQGLFTGRNTWFWFFAFGLFSFALYAILVNTNYLYQKNLQTLTDPKKTTQDKQSAAEELILSSEKVDKQILKLIIDNTPVNSEINNKALELF